MIYEVYRSFILNIHTFGEFYISWAYLKIYRDYSFYDRLHQPITVEYFPINQSEASSL